MAKFNFRLEKLLEFRRLQEKWAKDAYLESRARRNEGEIAIEEVRMRRFEVLRSSATSISSLRQMESYLMRLDDEEQASIAALGVLEDEEREARDAWIFAKSESEAIQKLREQAYADWKRDELRREQNELDEWSVMRRTA